MFKAVLCLGIGLTMVGPIEGEENSSAPTSLVYKAIVSCSDVPTLKCLRKRTVNFLQRASSLDSIPLWGDTLSLVKSEDNSSFSEEIVPTDRSIGETFVQFLDSHRVQLRLPRLSYFVPSSEGRGKKNKGYGLLAMTIVGAMMATGMAGLAAMAGKALAASMAALMMAAMAAMRKGGGGGGHGGSHSSYEVISIPSHHRHRSFLEAQQTQPPYKYETDPLIQDTR